MNTSCASESNLSSSLEKSKTHTHQIVGETRQRWTTTPHLLSSAQLSVAITVDQFPRRKLSVAPADGAAARQRSCGQYFRRCGEIT